MLDVRREYLNGDGEAFHAFRIQHETDRLYPIAIFVSLYHGRRPSDRSTSYTRIHTPLSGRSWPQHQVLARQRHQRPTAGAVPTSERSTARLPPLRRKPGRLGAQRWEVRWFRSAFAAEVHRANEYFGQPPAFRWGFVAEQRW
jgi:hypothetical protein